MGLFRGMHGRPLVFPATCSLWLAMAVGGAWAQPAPGAADASQETSAAAVEGALESERFDVWEYRVEGNTLLPVNNVERAVYGFLGPGKSIDDVEAARRALEQRYRDAGYGTVLVDIPEQDVEGGIVHLRVSEGKVSRLRVTGSRYFSLGRIRELAPSLAEGKVLYLPDVQKDLAALNRASSDRTITPVLRPGATPGTTEVELKVKDQFPAHAEVSVDDRFSRDTTRLRVNATVRYDNLWQREHGILLSYQTAPQAPSEVEVFSGTYLFPIPNSENRIALYGVHSDSNVAAIGTLAVIGKGDIYGLRGIFPLPEIENGYHSLVLGADYKDFAESVALLGADSQDTPIEYVNLLTEYNATAEDRSGLNRLNLGINFGIRGLGNEEEEFDDKRFRSRPNYVYLQAGFARTQKLPWDASLFARVDGQLSGSPLISNEQFSAGGVDSVRGYLESNVLADDGFTGTLELRSPSFAKTVWKALNELKLIAFVDGGRMRLQDPLPSQQSEFSLMSSGAGILLSAWDELSASLYWAWPFEEAEPVRPGESRLHFSVSYQL